MWFGNPLKTYSRLHFCRHFRNKIFHFLANFVSLDKPRGSTPRGNTPRASATRTTTRRTVTRRVATSHAACCHGACCPEARSHAACWHAACLLTKNWPKNEKFCSEKYSDKNVVGYMLSADSQIPKYRGHDLKCTTDKCPQNICT